MLLSCSSQLPPSLSAHKSSARLHTAGLPSHRKLGIIFLSHSILSSVSWKKTSLLMVFSIMSISKTIRCITFASPMFRSWLGTDIFTEFILWHSVHFVILLSSDNKVNYFDLLRVLRLSCQHTLSSSSFRTILMCLVDAVTSEYWTGRSNSYVP